MRIWMFTAVMLLLLAGCTDQGDQPLLSADGSEDPVADEAANATKPPVTTQFDGHFVAGARAPEGVGILLLTSPPQEFHVEDDVQFLVFFMEGDAAAGDLVVAAYDPAGERHAGQGAGTAQDPNVVLVEDPASGKWQYMGEPETAGVEASYTITVVAFFQPLDELPTDL